MNTSFYNGISGIKSHQFGIDVYANNISNIGTTGFIGKTPEFSTYFASALNDNANDYTANQIGNGSKAQANALDTSRQGIFTPTDRVFDLALDGGGFFGVQSIGNEIFYTRNGAFDVDIDGYLVDESGNYLMGTLGGNITQTTLDNSTLEDFGQYYRDSGVRDLGTAYAISQLGDVSLGEVNTQERIYLPDLLYFPPEATTEVNYQANLDPEILTETSLINIEDTNNIVLTENYPTVDITGTLSNNTELENLKAGDVITLTLKDQSNNSINIETTIDENFNFSVEDLNVASLENETLSFGDFINLEQEIANVEHFSTQIISPNGDKNILDMTFTKRVPQQNVETIWDADFQILSYEEEYIVENYNPAIEYDETIYNVDEDKGQVTKIYDPSLYKVNTGSGKVYRIVDEGTGYTRFGGGGDLLESTIPTLSNDGTALNIDIGSPYRDIPVTQTSNIEGNTITINGSISNLGIDENSIQIGDTVSVEITDINGETVSTSGKILDDGTWEAVYTNYPYDPDFTINSYVIKDSGYDGMISHVDLDKARISETNGYIEGLLTDYGMDENGNVIAEFDNGRTSAIAKVAIYQFRNEQGLSNVTSTLFNSTANSGDPLFFTNEDGGYRGTFIRTNNLEGSNVQFSTALTELIVMQKAFDASAKSITTSDQLIQNAINMKK